MGAKDVSTTPTAAGETARPIGAGKSSAKRKRPSSSQPAVKPLSLAGALQADTRESHLGMDLLLDLPPALHNLRGVVLVLVSMGLYYGRHKRKVNLVAKSRFQISKNDKMVESACAWMEGLGLSGANKDFFRGRVAAFFLSCYSKEEQ